MAEQKLCTVCGTIGNTKRNMKGSIFTELLLWCFFLLPGLIYSIWRHSTIAQVCRNCGSPAVIPLGSPVAQQVLANRGTTSGQVHPQAGVTELVRRAARDYIKLKGKNEQIQPRAQVRGAPVGKVIGGVVAGVLLLAFIGVLMNISTSTNTARQDSQARPVSIPVSQYADPATWTIKPSASRDPNGGIAISASTNIPDGVKLWVQLPNGATSKTQIASGRFSSEAFTNKGRPIQAGPQQVSFVAYFNEAWGQPAAVLELTGHDGGKLQGKLFHKTDRDVVDSPKFLEYRVSVDFPPVSANARAIGIVKTAILSVPGKGRSATDIATNINLFMASPGLREAKGWGANAKDGGKYEVYYDFMNGELGEEQAIWSVDLRTGTVKYVNENAKLFSWTPKD